MIVDLDQTEVPDPVRVGSKAATLAAARRAGLPVLPGFAVAAEASSHHLKIGARELEARGSGGARLAVIGEPILFASELIAAGSELGPNLVARSSTALEQSGEWSGAFTSYLDLTPADLPKAVAGCWASAYSVAAVDRQESAGIRPGSFEMPVLIQPALDPQTSGVAEIDADGTVVVHGVDGPPGPLLQGWVAGHRAHLSPGEEKRWVGSELIDSVGTGALNSLAEALVKAHLELGTNRCEWAIDGDLWILQLDVTQPPAVRTTESTTIELVDPAFLRVARAAIQAPGRLAQELIMPWALAGLPNESHVYSPTQEISQDEATRLSTELTSQVWSMSPEEAAEKSRRCVSEILGPDPRTTLEQLTTLSRPDPTAAAALLDFVRSKRRQETKRMGVGRWEPFVSAVVLSSGERQQGTPASSGIGAGIRTHIVEQPTSSRIAERKVISADQPLPSLASLLWDAAGIVTETGSPAAHLFESARSLGIPAVCGVEIPTDVDRIVAVDGYSGQVANIPLFDTA